MSDIRLVRQPVFGADDALIGYEIRFRDTHDGRHAFAQSVLSGSFDQMRGHLPAFVSCSRAQLVEDVYELTAPASAVLLLSPELAPDAEVISAVDRYCERGGSFALDDIGESPSPSEALLPYVSWVRLDLRGGDMDAVRRICQRIHENSGAQPIRLIADHVYDQPQYDAAVALGVHAYQGPYFSRAESLPTADLPSSTVATMRLMGLARDERVKDAELEAVLATDPVLTFQLLRMVNSAALGVGGVSSIGQALRLIGRASFLRWLAVAVAASRRSTTGVDEELVRKAVERGRLLEQLAGGPRDAGTLFLVGLFSLLDAVFKMPLEEILSRVALSGDATRALLHHDGPYADALAFAEAYELGMFEQANELATEMRVDTSKLGGFYATAISWAAETLSPKTDVVARP